MPTQPFVPFVNGAQVEMLYIQDGQHVENTFHFSIGTDLTLAKANAMADYMVNTWENVNMRPLRHTGVTWAGIRIRDLTSATGPIYTPTPSGAFVGTLAGSALPNNVTLAVKKNTARGGRSYRGRIFHIGLVESQVTGNTTNAGVTGSLATAYSVLLSSAAQTAVGILCVPSRRQNKAWLTEGIETPVTAFTIDSTVDSQRRRLPGRGK